MNKLSRISTEQLEELLGFFKYSSILPDTDSPAFQQLRVLLTNYIDDLIQFDWKGFLSVLRLTDITEKEVCNRINRNKTKKLTYGQIIANMILEKQNKRSARIISHNNL